MKMKNTYGQTYIPNPEVREHLQLPDFAIPNRFVGDGEGVVAATALDEPLLGVISASHRDTEIPK